MLAGPWRTHWRDNSLKMILRPGCGIKDSCAVLCVLSRHHRVYRPWFILNSNKQKHKPRFVQATQKRKSCSESFTALRHIKFAFCFVRTRDSCTLFEPVVNITSYSHLFSTGCNCLIQALEWNVPFLHSWSYYQNHYSCCWLAWLFTHLWKTNRITNRLPYLSVYQVNGLLGFSLSHWRRQFN